jgi:fucose permease
MLKTLAIVVSTLLASVIVTGVVMGLLVAVATETHYIEHVSGSVAFTVWAVIAVVSFLFVRKYLDT